MRALTFVTVFAVTTLAACNVEDYRPINIAVYPSTKSCAIKETPFDCGKAAIYLREALKVKLDRDIAVSYAGTETVAKGDTSIDQIADLLKANGFTHVRVVRYEMK